MNWFYHNLFLGLHVNGLILIALIGALATVIIMALRCK